MMQIEYLQAQFRDATKSHHKALDSEPVLRTLIGKDLDEQGYVLALQRMLAPHAYLESWVMQLVQSQAIEVTYQPRTEMLRGDLLYLGDAPDLVSAKWSFTDISQAQLLGILYLLEGSKLGSQHIVQRLRQNGLPERAIQFFSVDESVRGEWQGFWKTAQSVLNSEVQLQEAISTAQTAFEFYTDAIKRGNIAPEKFFLTA